jgi:hypothetical protein
MVCIALSVQNHFIYMLIITAFTLFYKIHSLYGTATPVVKYLTINNLKRYLTNDLSHKTTIKV